MTTIKRRVTKKGISIQGVYYVSPDLYSLIGQCASVDVPEGPLPQKLVARFGAHTLEIQDNRELIERRLAEDPAFRRFLDRRARYYGTDGPSRKPNLL